MPTSGASPTPRPDLNLLDEKRSAHASIRGYLYQTCLGVLRWLDLQPNEILLCEGDEDLDRFLLDGRTVSEQVKAYTGGLSITDRVVRDSLRNFLRSYVTLRQRGEDRKFVFTTTAYEKKKRTDGMDFDLLEKWKAGVRTSEVIDRVRSLVEPPEKDPNREEIEEARAWLDEQDGGWSGFMDAVEWSFSAPDLDALRSQIERKLMADRAAAAPASLLDRLVVHVLRTSSRGEAKDRILTRETLDAQISTFLTDLGRWACSPEGLRIRTVFDEIDRLRDLLDEGTRELPANPTPGQILTAAYEVIPFDEVGRQEELDLLASWCEREDRRSVLLLTGEGGSGKTRLMLEWCRRLRHQGWHAGFLMRNRDKNQILPLLKGTAPRLLVIDYAETRLEIVEPLLVETGQAPQREGPKLRIVLLARREADWWKSLSQLTGDVEALLADSEPRKISSSIPQDLGERQQAFQSATTGFSEALDRKIPTNLYVPDLSGPSFERVLYLHMAAYLALYGERIETGEDALRQTLNHERRFWGQQDRHLKKALESAVAAVTLVGGASTSQQAKALLDRILSPFSLDPGEGRILRNLLEDFYRGAERFLDPLQPDLLGEELVAEALEKDHDLLNGLLDDSSKESSAILTVLTRLARRRSDQEKWLVAALKGRLDRLGEIALNVAVETGDPMGPALAREIEGSEAIDVVTRLRRLCDDDKYQRSVPLREVARIATEKGYMLLRERKSDLDEAQLAEYSRLASNLGIRLRDLGRREEALKATQEAVEIWRRFAQQHPDAVRPVLATSLNGLGTMLRDLGRREEALKAIQEAVEIYRQLAQLRPNAVLTELATSLNNLGTMLSDLGRREEALQATAEAVEIYRQLARLRPDAVRPVLAMSLNNLGAMLSNLGRHEQALQAIQESVEIRRQLAQQRPDAFLTELAGSLNNLGAMLSELGRCEEALQATQEAVEIYRQLAQQRPDAFRPGLATSLNNLGSRLSDLGRREEALQATQEAVEIYRQLAQQRPDAFRPDLAGSLVNLSRDLSKMGQAVEAFQTIEEAVRIYSPFFLCLPAAFAPWMVIMAQAYLLCAEEAGLEPDQQLLAPIREVLESLRASKEPTP
jgi:tetratricopeptide (TPR) repeat protein